MSVTAVGDHFEGDNDGFKQEIQSVYCMRSTSKLNFQYLIKGAQHTMIIRIFEGRNREAASRAGVKLRESSFNMTRGCMKILKLEA